MSDLVVVGAGIVGLAHAVEAVARGLSVTVIERDDRAVGASVRNFGHGCVTAQEGRAYTFGGAERRTWLRLAREAGFWAAETGTVVAARAVEEMGCLTELAGHDLDRLLPAAAAGVRRCVLQMLQVRVPGGIAVGPALLTGSSLLRYPAFTATAGAAELRRRWARERPEMLDAVVNHMITQRPDGDLVIGDTHAYDTTISAVDPADSERLDDLLLAETRTLLGVREVAVVHRWRGVYASAVDGSEFLRAAVAPGVVAVSVTSGIGMTTAFGLAPDVLDELEKP